MTCYTPLQIAQEVVNQGGSKAQAWVAAALTDGIESNGCTDDKNPSSTACGLFQFLTTTWTGNGGGAFAPTACGATMAQQVTVFLTSSAGNNFYPWAPDLGGAYNGNTKQPAATTPQPGSKVANAIAQLASSTTIGALLGNVPTNWADAGGVAKGVGGGPASPAATSSGLSTCVIQFPGFLFFSGPCILTKGGVKWLSSVVALAAGAGLFTFGLVMLAAWGMDASGAKQAVTGTARKIGVGASLLTGQPEVALGLEATKARSSASSSRRQRPAASSSQPRPAGRLESRQIERRFQAAERQVGPIGPRGGVSRGQRARNLPGPGRNRPPRRQPSSRYGTPAAERQRRRAEGFERVS